MPAEAPTGAEVEVEVEAEAEAEAATMNTTPDTKAWKTRRPGHPNQSPRSLGARPNPVTMAKQDFRTVGQVNPNSLYVADRAAAGLTNLDNPLDPDVSYQQKDFRVQRRRDARRRLRNLHQAFEPSRCTCARSQITNSAVRKTLRHGPSSPRAILQAATAHARAQGGRAVWNDGMAQLTTCLCTGCVNYFDASERSTQSDSGKDGSWSS